MTAALSIETPRTIGGIRRFDPSRDLSALADLLEVGFAENLDHSGHRMVQGLRALGRLGWLGGLLSRWVLPPAANPQGYVWEQDGKVVANASLLPVTGFSTRWVMANVVVIPSERGKGVGRSLVANSIEFARTRGAKEIILQVDQDNEAATALYRNLGFTPSRPRISWSARASELNLPSAGAANVRLRKADEWQQQYQLARKLHPEGLIWPYPQSGAYFRPRTWQQRLGLRNDRHWVWVENQRVCGSASLRWGLEAGAMRLILLVEEGHRGQSEMPLIAAALRPLLPHGDVVHMDYPAGEAESGLMQLGFVQMRKLIWMKMEL